MRTFIIEGKEIDIAEEEIKSYSLIYEECFYQDSGRELRYEGELYWTEDGEILDREDSSKIVPEVLTNEDGEIIKFSKDFFLMESTEGFVLDYKLYLIPEVEEIS